MVPSKNFYIDLLFMYAVKHSYRLIANYVYLFLQLIIFGHVWK